MVSRTDLLKLKTLSFGKEAFMNCKTVVFESEAVVMRMRNRSVSSSVDPNGLECFAV